MIAAIDRMMTKGRGSRNSRRTTSFCWTYTVTANPGQTVADLYPQIIEWFEKKNRSLGLYDDLKP